jgi:hypothetical protein
MTDDRIYLLNDAGHVEAPPRIVRCNDDSTALRLARKFVESHPVEIWDLARHVGTIKPTVSFRPQQNESADAARRMHVEASMLRSTA